MAQFINALNSHSLRKPNSGYVIWYSGTLLVSNGRSLFHSLPQARSALSRVVSNAFHTTPSLTSQFPSVGAFRKYLEENQIAIIKDANSLGNIIFRE